MRNLAVKLGEGREEVLNRYKRKWKRKRRKLSTDIIKCNFASFSFPPSNYEYTVLQDPLSSFLFGKFCCLCYMKGIGYFSCCRYLNQPWWHSWVFSTVIWGTDVFIRALNFPFSINLFFFFFFFTTSSFHDVSYFSTIWKIVHQKEPLAQ